MINESIFETEMAKNPEIRVAFINKYKRTMLDLGIPPGTWCAGESQPETWERLSDYADQVAHRFREWPWMEINFCWSKNVQRLVMRAGTNVQFNLPILFQWLQEGLKQKTDPISTEKSPEIPARDELHLLVPHFASGLESNNDLPFANPSAGRVWQLMIEDIGATRAAEIYADAEFKWITALLNRTGIERKEKEPLNDYLARIEKRIPRNELPSGAIIFRKDLFREWAKLKINV